MRGARRLAHTSQTATEDVMKALLLIALGAGTLLLFAGCSDGTSADDTPAVTGATEVVVKDMTYAPRVIEVPAGTSVTWRFEDGDTPHDVKGDGFKSEVMRSGTFTHTFATAGSYDYTCTLHPQMKGRVVVTDSPA
jgi:plastocyanin